MDTQTSSDRSMIFDHIGIVNTTEETALTFYRDILGLEKIRESAVPALLAGQIFSFQTDIKMLVFGQGDLKVEVFIMPEFRSTSPTISHFCLRVPNLSGFLARMQQNGIKVITGSLPGKTVHFIEDFSGNRIEIKQG